MAPSLRGEELNDGNYEQQWRSISASPDSILRYAEACFPPGHHRICPGPFTRQGEPDRPPPITSLGHRRPKTRLNRSKGNLPPDAPHPSRALPPRFSSPSMTVPATVMPTTPGRLCWSLTVPRCDTIKSRWEIPNGWRYVVRGEVVRSGSSVLHCYDALHCTPLRCAADRTNLRTVLPSAACRLPPTHPAQLRSAQLSCESVVLVFFRFPATRILPRVMG